MKLIVHTDGGSRGNPGPAAAAFIITDSTGKLINQSGSYLGITTNNQAEYQAVLQALTWIRQNLSSLRATAGSVAISIDFYLDSELVCRQLSGQYKIKSKDLLSLALQIKNLQDSLNDLNIQTFFHSIPRDQNRAADRLVNQTLDSQIS